MTKKFKMRKVAIVFACLAVMAACSGGSSNKNAAQTSESNNTEAVSGTNGLYAIMKMLLCR